MSRALAGEQVSHEYFSVLGVTPGLAAMSRPKTILPNARRVVVISDGLLWNRRYGRASSAIGQMLTLGGGRTKSLEYLPAGFRPIVASAAGLAASSAYVNPARGAVVLRCRPAFREGDACGRTVSGNQSRETS